MNSDFNFRSDVLNFNRFSFIRVYFLWIDISLVFLLWPILGFCTSSICSRPVGKMSFIESMLTLLLLWPYDRAHWFSLFDDSKTLYGDLSFKSFDEVRIILFLPFTPFAALIFFCTPLTFNWLEMVGFIPFLVNFSLLYVFSFFAQNCWWFITFYNGICGICIYSKYDEFDIILVRNLDLAVLWSTSC